MAKPIKMKSLSLREAVASIHESNAVEKPNNQAKRTGLNQLLFLCDYYLCCSCMGSWFAVGCMQETNGSQGGTRDELKKGSEASVIP